MLIVCISTFNFQLSTVSAQIVAPPLPRWCADAPVLYPASASEAEIDSTYLFHTIDSIVCKAIEMHAFPGCQLFVARDGKVVIDCGYGWHDYSRTTSVATDDLYDIASITKITSSTLALAKLSEGYRIELDQPLSKYYRPLCYTDKKDITLRDILTHQSGLPSGIPAPWALGRERLLDTIRTVPLRSAGYRYSDLPFLLMPEVVRSADGRDFETYLAEEFYRPLGIGLTFNPLQHGVPITKIVPTEDDTWFRGTKEQPATVHGTVHDESAAIMGGVSGNAGLFGSARDLAVVMQMLLNGGIYDGKRYLRPATVAEFTRTQFPDSDNRRALGFDKPFPGNDTLPIVDAYPAPAVSRASFGHAGFTGTFVWADPEYGLIYVLMCNRVTSSRKNPAFSESQVRYTIQQAIYDAMKLFEIKK